MSMADPISIGVETLRIDSWCSLEKEFIELIRMNPWMVLYLTVNQVSSCHGCVCGPLTWDTKDILWMDDRVLIMTYESLVTGYLKRHEVHKDDCVIKMGSSTLSIWRDWLKEWDAMKSLAKVVEILKKEFSMISTRISTNLSDRLGFDSWPYPKSFMSLMWMKDYTYMVIDDGKVP